MSEMDEQVQMVCAVADLLSRGLLTHEEDPERAAVRVSGQGYRYLTRFWVRTGVLDATGPRWRVCVHDEHHPARPRDRIAAEWIAAGAPAAWARAEADTAVMILRVHLKSTARA